MGSGSSARKKAYAQTTSDSAILKQPSDGEIVGHLMWSGKKDKKKQAARAAQVAIEKHLMECKATDLQKVWTIRQAFPLSTSTGKRSASMLPEKLHCANCHAFIVKLDDEETEFFACKSCWEVGIRIGICAACRAALGGSGGSRPSSARSGAERGSKASLLIPNIKSGASLEPPRSRSSQRSNKSMSSGITCGRTTPWTAAARIRAAPRSGRHLSGGVVLPAKCRGLPWKGLAGRAPSRFPPGRAPNRFPPGRAPSRFPRGRVPRRRLRKQTCCLVACGLQPSKKERHLHFNPNGTVEGSGSFGGAVDGFVSKPHVEWTESYAWGNMLVKLKYLRSEPWLLEGHFEASDGGSGKITLVHEQLKAAVEMGT